MLTVTEEDGVVMKLGKLVAKGVAQDAVDAEVEVDVEAVTPEGKPETVEAEPVAAGSSAER